MSNKSGFSTKINHQIIKSKRRKSFLLCCLLHWKSLTLQQSTGKMSKCLGQCGAKRCKVLQMKLGYSPAATCECLCGMLAGEWLPP